MTKVLRIGIASYSDMKARTMAIARGEYKPGKDDPTVWVPSLESLAKILSGSNKELLQLIAERKPESITDLVEISGRAKSNLSRTLNTMARYGLVELTRGEHRRVVPRVLYDEIKFEIPLLPVRTGERTARGTDKAVA